MSEVTGRRVIGGSMTFARDHDPDWSVGDHVWLESTPPGITRPNYRARCRVVSRAPTGDGMTYEFENEPAPLPEQ